MSYRKNPYPHRTIIVNYGKDFSNLHNQYSVLKSQSLVLRNCKTLRGLVFTPLFDVNKLIYDKCHVQFISRTLYPWLYHNLSHIYIRMNNGDQCPQSVLNRLYFNEKINLFLVGKKKYEDDTYQPNIHYISAVQYSEILKNALEDYERDQIIL